MLNTLNSSSTLSLSPVLSSISVCSAPSADAFRPSLSLFDMDRWSDIGNLQ